MPSRTASLAARRAPLAPPVVMTLAVASALVLAMAPVPAAHAQAASAAAPDFPPDATPFAEGALATRLVGPTWEGTFPNGIHAEIEFKGGGTAFAQFSRGSRGDQGQWRVDGSTVCVDWRKTPNWCAEARDEGGKLSMKLQGDGGVFVLAPR
jgi:hypothetical protein